MICCLHVCCYYSGHNYVKIITPTGNVELQPGKWYISPFRNSLCILNIHEFFCVRVSAFGEISVPLGYCTLVGICAPTGLIAQNSTNFFSLRDKGYVATSCLHPFWCKHIFPLFHHAV